jgi:uncharacterized protein (DUF952 family)
MKGKVSSKIITKLDLKDGFVHLSKASQLNASLSLYFENEKRVVLLQIDKSKIKNNLKYEFSGKSINRHGKFPHFYGILDTNMISKIWKLQRSAFCIPQEVLLQAEQ